MPSFELNDIVLLLGSADDVPPRPCLGIVLNAYESGLYRVRVEQVTLRPNVETPAEILVGPETENMVLVARGDKDKKTAKSVDRALIKGIADIFVNIFDQIAGKQNLADNPLAPIAKGTLVILPNFEQVGRTCWGIIQEIMPSGQLDVTYGNKFFILRRRTFVSSKDVIPVLFLNKPGSNVHKILLKNLAFLLIIVFLNLLKLRNTKPGG